MLGSTQKVFERTVQYLKDRKQFGVAIGSLQALKHRRIDVLWVEIGCRLFSPLSRYATAEAPMHRRWSDWQR